MMKGFGAGRTRTGEEVETQGISGRLAKELASTAVVMGMLPEFVRASRKGQARAKGIKEERLAKEATRTWVVRTTSLQRLRDPRGGARGSRGHGVINLPVRVTKGFVGHVEKWVARH